MCKYGSFPPGEVFAPRCSGLDVKILVIGKIASVTHWLEDCVASWRAEGHAVRVAATRDPRLHPAIEAALLAKRIGAPLAARVARRARAFSPDLIVAIGAFHIPPPFLEALAALPARPPMVGWVGDVFSEGARPAAAALDLVAYTDSGLAALHERLGFAPPARYLPHAVNPHGAADDRAPRPRLARMVFVANPTPHRRDVVGKVRFSLSLHGPGWTAFPGVEHDIHPRRVTHAEVAGLYADHFAALNIRNELNVLAGLNQRNFEPCLAGAAMITDAQADLELCFEPGREVLAWREPEELNGCYERLLARPEEAAAIGALGRRRVLADHTYARRLATLTSLLGG